MELYRTIKAIGPANSAKVKAAQTAIRDLRATALHVPLRKGKS
jgi:hypothetical protein